MLAFVYPIAFLFVLFLLYKCYLNYSQKSFTEDHLLITGGSSGIGLAIAIEAVCGGASVTLIARNENKLANAVKKLIKKCVKPSQQKVLMFTADVAKGPDVADGAQKIADIVKQAEEIAGPITYLINCAGTSVSYRFEETPIEDFKNMLDINYLGSVYVTRAVLPHMKLRGKGKIVFVSSMAGLIGVYGYTAYSASKFALVGMAQALQMEVAPYGISVTISFPPDTDTPGFAEEIKSKPLETQLISESGGLYQASVVAKKTLKDAVNKRFMSSVGFEGWMLCSLCSGMSPVTTLWELFCQVCTMGAFRLVGFFYHMGCKRKIRDCMIRKEGENKQQ